MSLLRLSHEMIVHILSFLHYVDLNACRRVNRTLNRIIQDSSLLKYNMHLQLFGYRDNPSSPLVIADKLKLLIQQERAWSRLDFEKQTSVHLPFHPSSIYELSDGIFLLGEGSASLSGTNIIRWARLSSLADGMSSDEHWGRISVGAHIIDVGLSVQEHDLVVVATDRESEDHQTIFELHLVQLSTGLAHPLASKPVLTLATIPSPAQPIAGQCSVCIEVVGDLLCFMFHYPSGSTTPPAMFEVYDWKLGQCLQIRGIDCASYSTFTFLAPDVIALPNCADNTIELCRIGVRPADSAAPVALEPSCILQLPQLEKGHSIAQVTCRSEPRTTNVGAHARAFRSSDAFHLDPARVIAIFNVMTHDVQGWHECLTLIVHTSALLAMLASVEAVPDPPDRRVVWAAWGPRACRWLETSFGASRWITTTCGQRYVTVEEDAAEDESARATIVVFDFNPHTIRRLATRHRKQRRRHRRLGLSAGPPQPEAPVKDEEAQTAQGLEPLPHYEPQAALWAAFENEDIVRALAQAAAEATEPLIPFTDPETHVIGQIQCEPTVLTSIPADYKIFEETVRTALPYVQLSSYETYGYGAVLLDRNVIIGVKEAQLNDSDDIKELVIHSIRTGC